MLRRRLARLSLFGILLLSAPAFASVARAQPGPQLFFPETGHSVQEPFLQFFSATGGVGRYGFPITDYYIDSQTGLLIQYFQKARLEWHPGNPDPYKVQLGLLGDELGQRTPPLLVSQIPNVASGCQYFPQTGHSACARFLDHWREAGGADLFGYPIAEATIENDHIVQYFQRAKMEWHPEAPEGQRVQLAPLGQIYYDYAHLDRNRLKANPTSAIAGGLTGIRARGSVTDSFAQPAGMQTGFVYVCDQSGTPISGAAVTLVVHYPEGDQSFILPPTSSNGATFLSFDAGQAPPGKIVAMEFVVTYGGLFTRTRTSYMVWYD